MGSLIKRTSPDMIPSNIGEMTLNQLMSEGDVEIRKKDNILKMKRRTPSETIMVEVRSYDDTAIVFQSQTHRGKPFSQMESTIAQMRAEGRTQSEVADILGTTQTNISKIEKRMRKHK